DGDAVAGVLDHARRAPLVAHDADRVAVAVGDRGQVADLAELVLVVHLREVVGAAGPRVGDSQFVGLPVPDQRPAAAALGQDFGVAPGQRVVEALGVVAGEVDADSVDGQALVERRGPAGAEQAAGVVAGGVGAAQDQGQDAGEVHVGGLGEHPAGDDVDGVAVLDRGAAALGGAGFSADGVLGVLLGARAELA